MTPAQFMSFNRGWLDLEAEAYDVYVSDSKFIDAGLGLFAKKGQYYCGYF